MRQIIARSVSLIQLTFCIIVVDTNQKATLGTLPDECLFKRARVELL